MMELGGSFVKKIAEAYRLADELNQRKLKFAFLEYWEKYAMLVVRCPECGSSDFIKRHHYGTLAVPECDFKECERCGHHWDNT
jgi:Zn ribbon nucleic-acid-binding protein